MVGGRIEAISMPLSGFGVGAPNRSLVISGRELVRHQVTLIATGLIASPAFAAQGAFVLVGKFRAVTRNSLPSSTSVMPH
jgi:hypothetical protein